MIIIDVKHDFNGIRDKYTKAFSVGGEIQSYIDEQVLKGIEPYIPYDEGKLTDSGIANTKIGDGLIIWNTPYARQMWHGKSASGNDLNYQQGVHPLAGKYWAERYKADHMLELKGKVIRRINML